MLSQFSEMRESRGTRLNTQREHRKTDATSLRGKINDQVLSFRSLRVGQLYIELTCYYSLITYYFSNNLCIYFDGRVNKK